MKHVIFGHCKLDTRTCVFTTGDFAIAQVSILPWPHESRHADFLALDLVARLILSTSGSLKIHDLLAPETTAYLGVRWYRPPASPPSLLIVAASQGIPKTLAIGLIETPLSHLSLRGLRETCPTWNGKNGTRSLSCHVLSNTP